ncbi:MAG: hypothetical protein JRH01_16285 [Deltaproteobacteria bacterium]|nr:hypothetical protein [Deltaproteobacteria bacterium]
MSTTLDRWLREALTPVPTPTGVTSRELVRQAVELRAPARIPYAFLHPLESDFFELAELTRQLDREHAAALGSIYTDAWQVTHEVSPGLFDRVLEHPLEDLSRLSDYRFPSVHELIDMERLLPFARDARSAGKHIVAADPVLLFERVRSLMGFESMLLAPRVDRNGFQALLDALTDLTLESINDYARCADVDSFMTWQDFGTQSGLMVGPEEFRTLYAPGLTRVAQAAHDHGMYFILHCCGRIEGLIPEFIEIGVDVLQLDQPRLIGHQTLRERFGGKVCFWNAVDTLWSSQGNRSTQAIESEVREMRTAFSDLPGGLMARHYPQPEDIDLPDGFHEVSRQAFLRAMVASTSRGSI